MRVHSCQVRQAARKAAGTVVALDKEEAGDGRTVGSSGAGTLGSSAGAAGTLAGDTAGSSYEADTFGLSVGSPYNKGTGTDHY